MENSIYKQSKILKQYELSIDIVVYIINNIYNIT